MSLQQQLISVTKALYFCNAFKAQPLAQFKKMPIPAIRIFFPYKS